MSSPAQAWIALNLVDGIGPATAYRLASACGGPERVWTAGVRGWLKAGLTPELAERLSAFAWQEAAQREEERCRRVGCSLLTRDDPEYPVLLSHIACPPPVLYLRGRLEARDRRALAVVGCRRPSQYGLAATRALTRDLARSGYTIVSGLARGVDAEAHRAALAAGGRTVAVLAHGLDRVYPREHASLLDAVCRQGAAVSEFPIGTPPVRANFPRRNRLISGLATGVLVTEASDRSGSLITARWAVHQGRDVFAVPGGFNAPLSQGTHALIQDGAKLVTSAADILDEVAPPLPEPPPAVTPDQQRVLDALGTQGGHIDQLSLTLGRPVPALLGELLELELQGWVTVSPGQWYARADRVPVA